MMPRLIEIAKEVLGETVSNILNLEQCYSVDDFLLNYQAVKTANEHTVGEQNISLLRCAIISKYRPLVKSGQHLSQKAFEQTVVLRTGSTKLDKLLGGGLYTCEVAEVYGRSACGKTQLALHVSALACLKHRANVLYIDTTNCFSAERMVEIMRKLKATDELIDRMLKRIMVSLVFDVYQLQTVLYNFITCRKTKSSVFEEKVKLIVIDNITSLLSPLLGYKCSEGYRLANSISSLIRRISREHHVAVLVINGTVSSPTGLGLPKAALGMQWKHTADRRLLLSAYNDSSPDLYECSLVSSRKEGYT